MLCIILAAELAACGEKHENIGAYQWADYDVYSLPEAEEEHKFQYLYLDVTVEDTANGGASTGLIVKDRKGNQWDMMLAVSPRSTFEGAEKLVGQKARIFFTYGGISRLYDMPLGMLIADSDRIELKDGTVYRPVFHELEDDSSSSSDSEGFAISVNVAFDEDNWLSFSLPVDKTRPGLIACFFDGKDPAAAYSRMLSAVLLMQELVDDANVAISFGEDTGAYGYEGEKITILSPIEAFDETVAPDEDIVWEARQAILAQLTAYLATNLS